MIDSGGFQIFSLGEGRKQDLSKVASEFTGEGDRGQHPPAANAKPLVRVDEALAGLAEEDRVKAELVKLRYFVGLSIPEAGRALGLSESTAKRYWTFARAWLYDELTRPE